MFRSFDELLDAARARGPVSIAVAAAHDPDVIEALKRARELGLAEGILVGRGSEIRALARKGGFDVSRQPDRQRTRPSGGHAAGHCSDAGSPPRAADETQNRALPI